MAAKAGKKEGIGVTSNTQTKMVESMECYLQRLVVTKARIKRNWFREDETKFCEQYQEIFVAIKSGKFRICEFLSCFSSRYTPLCM